MKSLFLICLLCVVGLFATVWVVQNNPDSIYSKNTTSNPNTTETPSTNSSTSSSTSNTKWYLVDNDTMEDQTICLEGYPPINISGNNTIIRLSYNLVVEALQDCPEWLLENCSAIYLESDEVMNSEQDADHVSASEMAGITYRSDLSVHIRSQIWKDSESGKMSWKYYDENSRNGCLKNIKMTLYHELAHTYDFAYGVVSNYDLSVLTSNTAGVCSSSSANDTHYNYCSSYPVETFADAICCYVMGIDLPDGVQGWIDELPK